MGTDRYLHEINASEVWFYVVTNFPGYHPISLTLRNRISVKRCTKEVHGFKKVRHSKTEIELLNTEWALAEMIIWS